MTTNLIDLSQWKSTLSPFSNDVVVGGMPFQVQNAAKSYSLTSPTLATARFEVRSGDRAWVDSSTSGKERSEIATDAIFGNDVQINVAYGFKIEPGAVNTADFSVFGQFHQNANDGNSPPFEIDMVGEKMAIYIEYAKSSGDIVETPVYMDTRNIVRGHTYIMQLQVTFDTSGHGHLVVIRDGIPLVNYVGSLGYANMGGVYWKEGVYRSASSETIAADYSNLRISTSAATLTLPPTVPTISFAQALGSDSGASTSDGVSKDGYVMLTGSATAGSIISVKDGATIVGYTQADGTGAWSYSKTLSQGVHTLSAIATLSGQSSSFTAQTPVVVDTTAPKTPTLSAITAGGALINPNGISTSNKVVIAGGGDAGSTIEVVVDGNVVGAVVSDSTGHWAYDYTTQPLSVGYHWFAAFAQDLAGNSSNWATAVTISIVNGPKSVSFIQTLGTDSGASNTDFITKNGWTVLKGSAAADAAVSIKDGSVVIGSAVADGSGAWSFSTSLTVGTHVLGAVATADGRTTSYTSLQPIVVDQSGPSKPTITSMTPDHGYFTADGVTNSGNLSFAGASDPGLLLNIYVDGIAVGKTKSDSSGHWAFDNGANTIADGGHWVAAVADDAAGNHSAWSTAFIVTIDTKTPPIAITSVGQGSGSLILSGTTQIGATITLYDGALTLASAVSDSKGVWNATISQSQSSVHTYLITSEDAAGNYTIPAHLLVGFSGADTLRSIAPGDILWGAAGGAGDTFVLDATSADGTAIQSFEAAHDRLEFTGFAASSAHLTQINTTHWQIADGVHTATFQLSNAVVLHSGDYFFG